ncbi:circadian clock KaiB family protein [Cyanobacterium aponinum UTEX 3222]|uniref:KaiB domain protein n=3 Tax=Cyanobacterium aponinum TaxID=379064 RepID=K9Z6V7_CYAAP|nr:MULTISPECIES: circadian clock KaiB family protein [Cyanobacterium]WRL43095.1 circadian clock KaiB family protein [Cyanobacterium aponinum UTEX 3222]AFZ54926.1 KaiB domain protein [Cyanobacterium aponinum PCC 10605]MBD2395014.1 circadian clock protein KaiB [Cyanobacterium aponinum FACHB-4101]MTF39867.1 circadian clock protein KaiB [Cyanobacterium aponinum 0216]PHV64375.1 circadian clock protein KaiB [Cyanobacterium aponinum IPPAS B-1201]
MSNYLLRLYITGNSLNSQRAIANLLKLCREELNNKYQVEIIDVLEEPARAEREKILVTPTLIKQLPPPLQRIIGDLSNRENVICGLDLIDQ